LIAGVTIGEELLVPPYTFNDGTGKRCHTEPPLRKPAAHIAIGYRTHENTILLLIITDRDSITSIIPVDGHMA
jgi:hypothetical protein